MEGAAIAAEQCRWYNKRHERKGTLWMDRYKSVLVEGRRERRGDAGASQVDVLRVMACYIDSWGGRGDGPRRLVSTWKQGKLQEFGRLGKAAVVMFPNRLLVSLRKLRFSPKASTITSCSTPSAAVEMRDLWSK